VARPGADRGGSGRRASDARGPQGGLSVDGQRLRGQPAEHPGKIRPGGLKPRTSTQSFKRSAHESGAAVSLVRAGDAGSASERFVARKVAKAQREECLLWRVAPARIWNCAFGAKGSRFFAPLCLCVQPFGRRGSCLSKEAHYKL